MMGHRSHNNGPSRITRIIQFETSIRSFNITSPRIVLTAAYCCCCYLRSTRNQCSALLELRLGYFAQRVDLRGLSCDDSLGQFICLRHHRHFRYHIRRSRGFDNNHSDTLLLARTYKSIEAEKILDHLGHRHGCHRLNLRAKLSVWASSIYALCFDRYSIPPGH